VPHRDLKHKPLVEAILEVRWRLTKGPDGPATDPHYKLLLGRLFDRLRNEYPEHEALPAASIPDELVGHVVQHRFRVAPGQWPLVQLGPGILTANETDKYVWSDFRPRLTHAVKEVYAAHPKVTDLVVQSLVLRYVDAVEFDYETEDAFRFLQDKLKVQLALPASLFDGTPVNRTPRSSSWQASFRCNEPAGRVHLSFATGRKADRPAILWETTVQSTDEDVPRLPDEFPNWLDAAHTITSDWFFKLIEGDLERRFADD
jgi:uncharacterized protein (TIGR04255 family)